MQTLRQILGRESERNNLKNVGFCVGIVLVLVALTFALVHTKFAFDSSPATNAAAPASTEVRANY